MRKPPRTLKPFDLPQEIIDNILDHLAQISDKDDEARQTLRSCLVVSRLFTRRSRQNLLLDVTVSQQTWSRTQVLMRTFRQEPFLLTCLRSLQLRVAEQEEPNYDQVLEFTQMTVGRCPNLKHLAVAFYGHDPELDTSSPFSFHLGLRTDVFTMISGANLNSLALTNMFHIPMEAVLLDCFHLERLEVVKCHFISKEVSIDRIPDLLPFYRTVKYLRISNDNDNFFVAATAVHVGQRPRFSKLESLVWEFSSHDDIFWMGVHLESAPLLETLELWVLFNNTESFSNDPSNPRTHRLNDTDTPDTPERVHLGRIKSLKTLTLNIITSDPSNLLGHTTDCVIFSPFSFRSPPTVHVININVTAYCKWFDIEDFMENDRTGWRYLDGSLSNPKSYPNLTHVNLCFHLLPLPGTVLPPLSELKTEFSVLYRFPRLARREGLALTTSVTRE
ncbi:hypothetical protein CVT24_012637 [Panaeolus cyanescens]|uniref:F-box domain-containing protein n=1 Tax=Panaeolus cyanescens TaxID=181874 RepID=A0A409W2M0_9AGAR|nr:hypothetical protein CVT24_012637 [Panaeolus cyanescens]